MHKIDCVFVAKQPIHREQSRSNGEGEPCNKGGVEQLQAGRMVRSESFHRSLLSMSFIKKEKNS
ncbi:MAG: hypothetical protein FWE28_07510 [Oscillospiraceae bacterium]|nr:hypothetical protein [Oscillospiraceae bacterium]